MFIQRHKTCWQQTMKLDANSVKCSIFKEIIFPYVWIWYLYDKQDNIIRFCFTCSLYKKIYKKINYIRETHHMNLTRWSHTLYELYFYSHWDPVCRYPLFCPLNPEKESAWYLVKMHQITDTQICHTLTLLKENV